MEAVTDFIFLGSKITVGDDHSREIKRCLLLGRKIMTNQWHHFADQGRHSQSYDFSSHVQMLDAQINHKEDWTPENWCFWIVELEKTLEHPLNSKIKPIHPKGNQSWMFTGRTDAEAETPILWPADAKNWFLGGKKTLMLGKIERRRRRGWQRMRWMASLTRWTRVWVNSGSWWWTGRPGVLQFMGSQRVGHNWATELNWI